MCRMFASVYMYKRSKICIVQLYSVFLCQKFLFNLNQTFLMLLILMLLEHDIQ